MRLAVVASLLLALAATASAASQVCCEGERKNRADMPPLPIRRDPSRGKLLKDALSISPPSSIEVYVLLR